MSVQSDGIKKKVFAYLGHVWGYSGTLAVLSLLLGVLGMGIYHIFFFDSAPEGAGRSLFFRGIFNTAEPQAPEGIGLLPLGEESMKGADYIRMDYSPQGRCVRAVHVGAAGVPVPMPGSRVAEQRICYDATGRVSSKSNFDARGAAVEDASGVAVREYEYDHAGRLVRRSLKNARGQLVVPRMPGYAEQRIRYDAAGRPLSITHWDGKGKPITNIDGESEVRFSYDAAGLRQQRVNYVDGMPRNNAYGIAVEKKTRTVDALSGHTDWLDEKSQPVANPDTGAYAVLEYKTPSTRARRVRMCAADGTAMQSARACSEHVLRMDAAGRVEWECYQGADGMPCNNAALGFAERVCEYSPDGALLREYFWDAMGNPASCYEKRHIAKGGAHYVLSLHADGSTSIHAEP